MARLVIADDDPQIRELLSLWLTRRGHAVRMAEHGEQALALLDDEPADLVISDIVMPVMNGVDLARTLKQRGVTLILMTGHTTGLAGEDELRALSHTLLLKPFALRELGAAIEAALSG
jgi:two-component system, cell cycle response regulator CpdR